MSTCAQRLQEMKLKRLKFTNIPWITVQTATMKVSGRQSSRAQTPVVQARSTQRAPSETKRPTTAYFKHSKMRFTDNEMTQLEKVEGKPESRSPKSPTVRVESRLQILQRKTADESLQEQHGIKLSRKFTSFLDRGAKVEYIERCDSVMSITSLDAPLEAEADEDSPTNDRSGEIHIPNTGGVTIDDIKEHVWIYAHDELKKEEMIPVKHMEGVMEMDGQRRTISLAKTRGQRKVTNAISEHSSVEREYEDLRRRMENDCLVATDDRCKEGLERSYSALKYRKYLYKRKMKVPKFVEDCDFTDLQKRRAEEKELFRLVGWSGMVLDVRKNGK